MTNNDRRRYDMLVRVNQFGIEHHDLFPADSLGGKAFAIVTQAVASLGEHAASQVSGRSTVRESTTSRAVARRRLRDNIDAIVRTARALAIEMPGFDDKFRMPRTGADQTLLATARAFASDAVPYTDQFIAHDMPQDFLANLQGSISGFERATHEQESGTDTHVAARVLIATAMEAATGAVRRLDAIVRNKLRGDAATIALWNRAKHVDARSRRAETPAPVATGKAQGPGPQAQEGISQ